MANTQLSFDDYVVMLDAQRAARLAAAARKAAARKAAATRRRNARLASAGRSGRHLVQQVAVFFIGLSVLFGIFALIG